MFGRKGVKRVQAIEPTEDSSFEGESVEGFSLEQLGSAYAHALQQEPHAVTQASDPVTASTDVSSNGVSLSDDTETEELLTAPSVEESDNVSVTPESILEAMLFLGSLDNKPLPIVRLCELFRGFTQEDLQATVDHLNDMYSQTDRAFEIVKEPGGYRMQLRSELSILRERFYGKIKDTRLTQSAIDCLSLVAYQPGITKEELEKQWNQPAGNMLGTLVRKGLLRIEKGEAPKSSHLHYYTTGRLLEVVGLESLDDLPSSDEI
jgi:segregation and condensation protein B